MKVVTLDQFSFNSWPNFLVLQFYFIFTFFLGLIVVDIGSWPITLLYSLFISFSMVHEVSACDTHPCEREN